MVRKKEKLCIEFASYENMHARPIAAKLSKTRQNAIVRNFTFSTGEGPGGVKLVFTIDHVRPIHGVGAPSSSKSDGCNTDSAKHVR